MSPQPRQILFRLIFILALSVSACGSSLEQSGTPTPAIPSSTPPPPTPTPPPLAALVNDEWITEEKFLAEVERYRVAQEKVGNDVSAEDAAQVVLDDLIAQVLLAQAAREAGFEIMEEDLQTRMDLLASQAGGIDALSDWQLNYGYTDESFQTALKLSIEAAWMRDKIIKNVGGTAEQVHARQILLYNEETAIEVVDQLRNGAEFADFANLYDPNTGGDLGWFPRGYLLEPKLETAAFTLEPGQFSDVITTDIGYHIIFVIDRDSQHLLSPDAYLVLQENALQEWLTQRRSESTIVLAP